MRLFVTGSTGFLGKHVVAAAVAAGHDVVALVRPKARVQQLGWEQHPRVTIVSGDLRQAEQLLPALENVDAVLHLAAAKAGSFYAQFAGTVLATENLLRVMDQARVKKLVLISTFSVYDYTAMRAGSVLTEDSPIEDEPAGRDEYCQTKLIQEQLVRDAESAGALRAVILRPGVVYGGQDNLWTARLGFKLGTKWWVRTGANLRLPLTYVENCAQAIVRAAAVDAACGQTLNVIDDDRPTTRAYMRRLADQNEPRPRIVPVNYTLMRLVAGCGVLVNRVCCGGRAKVPSIFRPAALAARCKPLRFDASRIRNVLAWRPAFDLDQAVRRSVEGLCDRAVVLSSVEPGDPVSVGDSQKKQEAPCGSPT